VKRRACSRDRSAPGQRARAALLYASRGAEVASPMYGVRKYLISSRVHYDYYDVDRDARAQDFVLAMNDGRRGIPMVVIDERIITNPTLAELRRVLEEHRIEDEPTSGIGSPTESYGRVEHTRSSD
jgi:glutaredoxin